MGLKKDIGLIIIAFGKSKMYHLNLHPPKKQKPTIIMPKNLVIVESPAKAKTIEGYLGKDFIVKSSFGHIRDLASNKLSIDVENNFLPEYSISADKKKVIDELKKLVKSSEMVWLATDEDREGEAISWHLQEVLGLKPEMTKRIVFHEITKSAILKAIESPRDLDVHLVNAQQARRVLDRLVGFELSPVLWKKVRPSLSAGRVQSVAVRIIVEREREIEAFQKESHFRIAADLDSGKGMIRAEYSKKVTNVEVAKKVLEEAAGKSFSVDALEKKPAKRTPAAPFTTSTLQQEAGRKLGFSVAQTMQVAQRLYESGKITYMRTDSTNLSETALQGARESIVSNFGLNYAERRTFATKSKGAQEAHEAIRPTDFSAEKVTGERNEQRLYELIWKRSIASQMADAQLERTTIDFLPIGTDHKFVAKGEIILFDGFLKVYLESTDEESSDDDQKGMLPSVQKDQILPADLIVATERYSQAPPRYSEPALVKVLEELGIGRPSTYAPTISTIQKRGYVIKESREGVKREFRVLTVQKSGIKEVVKTENHGAEKGKLFPTDIGIVVTDFLVENFRTILDYNFTATVEREFDDIAMGALVWTEMLSRFYKPFHANVEETTETSARVSGERSLGIDPKSGKPVSARIGRFGPMIQIGGQEDEEKKYARLKSDQSITNISLEEALDLFKLPRTLGEFEALEVAVGTGRFGPYVRHGKTFVSIPKSEGDDPMTLSYERAVELITNKREAAAKATIQTFVEDPQLFVLEGRFGPYIKSGKDNFKIPKGKEAATLTLEEIKEIISSTEPSGKKRKK